MIAPFSRTLAELPWEQADRYGDQPAMTSRHVMGGLDPPIARHAVV